MKGTKLEFVLFNRQNLEDQVPTAFNWILTVFLSGKLGATDKHLRRPSTSNTPTTQALLTTTHCSKYCINKYIYIYTHISPAMPLISGTMLIYTEWCSVILKKVFFFPKEKVPKIKENIQKGEKCQCHMVCFLETSLP